MASRNVAPNVRFCMSAANLTDVYDKCSSKIEEKGEMKSDQVDFLSVALLRQTIEQHNIKVQNATSTHTFENKNCTTSTQMLTFMKQRCE